MIKRLPHYAEHLFASLCAEGGVVCNPSEQDECGWDFFLQFPARRSERQPADMQSPGAEALVQVKSTRTPPLVARMRLSNAFRAVQTAQPYFILLVVPGDGHPKIYARHFWEKEIARTLRRVRLAERDGDTRFNRKWFDLTLGAADDHGGDLLAWMEATIEQVGAYSAEKARLAKTLGFEDGFGTMTITFEASHNDIVAWDLGLKDGLPAREIELIPQRFGIDAPRPIVRGERLTVHVEPVGRDCRLRLQGGLPTAEITIRATLFATNLPGLSDDERRWRIDAGLLQLLGGAGQHSATLSFRYDDKRPLDELQSFLTLATWAGGGPVGMQILIDGERVPLGTMTVPQDEGLDHLRAFAPWVATLQRLEAADPDKKPFLSVVDLADAELRLKRFSGLADSRIFKMNYEPEGVDTPVRAMVCWLACDVGDWSFLAVIERATAADTRQGTRRELDFHQPRLLDGMVREGPWANHRNEIEQAYRMQIERLGDPDTLWEMGDLEAFIAAMTAPSS